MQGLETFLLPDEVIIFEIFKLLKKSGCQSKDMNRPNSNGTGLMIGISNSSTDFREFQRDEFDHATAVPPENQPSRIMSDRFLYKATFQPGDTVLRAPGC